VNFADPTMPTRNLQP